MSEDDKLDNAIRAAVAAAPQLSEEQREQVARLLRPSGRHAA